MGKCTICTQVFLFVVNLIFIILGIVAFSIGIWLLVIDEDLSFLTGNSIASGAALLLVGGIITFIVSAIGIIGAIFKLRPLLLIYAAILTIIVILEIVAGILGAVFSDEITNTIQENSEDAIKRYRVDENDAEYSDSVNRAVDYVQNTFDCCGFSNATDWFNLNPDAIPRNGDPPPECNACRLDQEGCMTFNGTVESLSNRNITEELTFNTFGGCLDAVSDRSTVLVSVVAGIGIVFGVLEIFGIVLALFLCCCIHSSKRQEKV